MSAPNTCARCNAALPVTRSGVPRQRARYCTEACRRAAVRDQRRAARAQLLVALNDLSAASNRAANALRILGLHPTHQRSRPTS
jgi:hypothetical protein